MSTQKEQLISSLSDILFDEQRPAEERAHARRALERLSDESALLRLLQRAASSDSAQGVMQVLDMLTSRRSLAELEPFLLGFLYDSVPGVRQGVLRLLAEKGTPRIIPYLDEIIGAALKGSSIFDADDIAAASRARQSIAARAPSPS